MTGFACYTTLLPTLMKAWGLNNAEAGLIGGTLHGLHGCGSRRVLPIMSIRAVSIFFMPVVRRRTLVLRCSRADCGAHVVPVPDRCGTCRHLHPTEELTDHLDNTCDRFLYRRLIWLG
jgi:hypothetical protein